jgi:hypothetical protein
MTINPYESPAQPPKPDLPGVKYLVDRRRLTLVEQCQFSSNALKGCWRWLTLQLGLAGSSTFVLTVPRVPEMVTELADLPPEVAEHFLIYQQYAETCGFYGRWTSTTVDEYGNAATCILRMLSHDPRMYLEVAFVGIDHQYISRHNLISATVAGEYLATSNGFPAGKRPPMVKPQYHQGLPFNYLLPLHQARMASYPQPFREVRTWDDMMTIVQELVDGYIEFQIARGFYTLLEQQPTGNA